jgi:hypothetical protein
VRKFITNIIYACASAACSFLMVCRYPTINERLSGLLLSWILVYGVPLFFVFACPRFVLADPTRTGRVNWALVLNGIAALAVVILFPVLVLPFWKNPLDNVPDSVLIVVIPLAVLTIFLIAAISLCLRGKSSFALLASFLLWPYWIVLALSSVGRFFNGGPLDAVYFILFFMAAPFLAFAAGALSHRPKIAHIAALVGLLGMPWLYANVMRDSGLGNVWVAFNLSGEIRSTVLDRIYPAFAILAVAFTALAVATAAIRLLPAGWEARQRLLRDRIWPAVLATFVVVATWYLQSVLPYRIPGAVDRSDWPIFQILHIEKRGLQFHETRVSIWGRLGQPRRTPTQVSFSHNDRRLLQYRFREIGERGVLTPPMTQRISALLSPSGQRGKSDIVTPIRNWNADRWYVDDENSGLKIYDVVHGPLPPKEIVDLFNDLEVLPRTPSNWPADERADVCFGFCYDPLSELGLLFANNRCFNAGHGTVCR